MKPLTLALSGGGAKGAAHAGVLAVLADARVPVAAIAGASAGGIVGVLHGLGYSPFAIRDYIADTHLLDMWEPDPTGRAVFGAEKIRARLREAVGDKTFADLQIPVAVVATDLNTGREVCLNLGRLDDALLATSAIPGIFTPAIIGAATLADGSIVNPLPVDVARRMGARVLAVDVMYHLPPPDALVRLFENRGALRYAAELGRRLPLMNIAEVTYQTVAATTRRLTEHNLQRNPPDILLRPEVGQVGLFASDLANFAFQQGEAAARAALPQLEALVRPRLDSPESWKAQLASALRRIAAGQDLSSILRAWSANEQHDRE